MSVMKIFFTTLLLVSCSFGKSIDGVYDCTASSDVYITIDTKTHTWDKVLPNNGRSIKAPDAKFLIKKTATNKFDLITEIFGQQVIEKLTYNRSKDSITIKDRFGGNGWNYTCKRVNSTK